jgi:hypothetical protein
MWSGFSYIDISRFLLVAVHEEGMERKKERERGNIKMAFESRNGHLFLLLT